MAGDATLPRKRALDILGDVTEERRLLSEVLPKRTASLAPEDRARVQRLVTTTLRAMDRADRALGPHLKKRPAPRVMNLLRLGMVEICDLVEAPHGVVNSAVAIARSDKKTEGMAGLVNAVLRKADIEGWPNLPIPRLPKWLRKPLVDDYGKEIVAAIEAAHYAGAPIDLTPKGEADAVARAVGGTVLPNGTVRLAGQVQVTALPGYDAGDWWVQDVAASLPARVLGAKPGERVLDLCAAPGGKTLQLAAAGADVTAVDVNAARMARVEENLARTGLSATCVVSDALEYEAPAFDAVLLDAPCTATGTIRRHPDLPQAKDGADFPGLFELQEHLIDRALGLLKPGGRLVYCTCSLLIDEGEEQVRDALARHPGLRVEAISPGDTGFDFAVDELGGLRLRPDFLPEQGGMDGFYIARFVKA
ncbi:RsmB/NOP family class I SAM-dependent RNA methyltransferase [Maritimibacter sp. DP1N21-5]|uniref:RsmB/NOP family class I SAM-dependent RNA methyltransferase n=1 Tax=Maritimibacter sp. DP1N21-5 TaxID=2836867 RepID=UPI001C447095|nr:transcription antitermination factor NusB [Maritimibacter sp. DP1N21-5]MBV7407869.1 methyltransferase domain-containing protein [Maritimibacter sp. DP1N21-5]